MYILYLYIFTFNIIYIYIYKHTLHRYSINLGNNMTVMAGKNLPSTTYIYHQSIRKKIIK